MMLLVIAAHARSTGMVVGLYIAEDAQTTGVDGNAVIYSLFGV